MYVAGMCYTILTGSALEENSYYFWHPIMIYLCDDQIVRRDVMLNYIVELFRMNLEVCSLKRSAKLYSLTNQMKWATVLKSHQKN